MLPEHQNQFYPLLLHELPQRVLSPPVYPLRPQLQRLAIELDGVHPAADPLGLRLQQSHRQRGILLAKAVSGGQPGNTGANHDDVEVSPSGKGEAVIMHVIHAELLRLQYKRE